MKTIAHILDDTNVGGVTRGLESHIARLSSAFSCVTIAVDTSRPIASDVPHDVAVVHFTPSWAKLPYLTTLRARRKSRPIVFVEHTYTRAFEDLHVHNRRRFRLMLRLTYRLCDAVVAVSEGQAAWLIETGVVPAEKVTVIRSARNCSMLFDLPLPEHHEGALRIVAYGRYCEQKGFENLIDAMRQVPAGVATLTLAGYGPLEVSLRSRARGLSHVEVRGAVEDIRTLLSDHDAVVVPSRYEAFGIVAAEARAAGRPVIAADVDGLTEQVVPGSGVLVPPNDVSALADAIAGLTSSDLSAMGKVGRASALDHFENHVHGWLALLTRMTEEHGAALNASASAGKAA